MNTELQNQNESQERAPQVQSWAAPPVDIYENSDGFIILAELPGVSKQDVSLEFEGEELRLRATRQLESEGPLHALRRAFQLRGVDGERLSAELKDGLLRVEAPKLARLKARSIPLA